MLFAFLWVILLTAWLCDDAFITLRTVDNLVNGYGPVWNTDERVQAFTHPLWMLLLSAFYFFTREAYFTTLLVSVGASCIAVALLTLFAQRRWYLLLFLGVAITGSKAFVDFSTSGLENPLTHLLLALFAMAHLAAQRDSMQAPRWLGLLAGLIALNRLDLGLLVAPAVGAHLLRPKSNYTRLATATLAAVPTLAWLAFSTLYYGFPLPNTFYAKQAASVARSEYVERGIAYFLEILVHDPLTLAVVLTGVVLPWLNRFVRGCRPLAAGMMAYSVYIVWVGGDFMQGRFFSGMFVWALITITRAVAEQPNARLAALASSATAFVLGLLANPVPNWLSSYPYPHVDFNRITPEHPLYYLRYPSVVHINNVVDERSAYYSATGLLPLILGKGRMENYGLVRDAMHFRQQHIRLSTEHMIGFQGFFSGPRVRIIDGVGLADAFLARMPFVPPTPEWRIGHLTRRIPDGYVTTRLYGRNSLKSQRLRQLYEDLHLLNTQPLLSKERLRTIVKLNLSPPQISLSDISDPTSDWMLNSAQRALLQVPPQGLTFFTNAPSEPVPSGILLLASAASSYLLEIAHDQTESKGTRKYFLPPRPDLPIDALTAHVINTNARANEAFNIIHLTPTSVVSPLTAGLFRLLNPASERDTEALSRYAIRLGSFADPHSALSEGLFASAWHISERQDEVLELALEATCAEGMTASATVGARVNGSALASVNLDCNSGIQHFSLNVPSQKLELGWNALELRLHRNGPIAISIRQIAIRET